MYKIQVAILAVLLSASSAFAQTYTWNGGLAGTWGDTLGGWLNPGNSPVNWANNTNLVAGFTGTGVLTVNVDAGGVTTDGLLFSATGYNLGGTGTITLTGAGVVSVGTTQTATVSNVIAGTAGLDKQGLGTLFSTGTNTFSGVLVFRGGTFNAATLNNYGSNGSLGNRASIADVSQDIGLLFNGGTLQYTGTGAQSTNRAIRIGLEGGTIDASGANTNATVSFTNTDSPDFWENPGSRTLTLTGSNTGTNTFAMRIKDIPNVTTVNLTKSGIGTWFITNTTNNYNGITTFNGGILNVASLSDYGTDGSLGRKSVDTDVDNIGLTFNGGTLQYTGSTAQSTNRMIRIGLNGAVIDASGSNTNATLTFSAQDSINFWLNAGERTLTLTGTNTGTNTFAQRIKESTNSNTIVNLEKTGTGTWYLTNTTNSHNGVTIFAGGVLNVAGLNNYDTDGVLGNRASATENTIDGLQKIGLLFRGGTLQYTGSTAQTTNRLIRVSIVGGGGTIDASGSIPSATVTFNGSIANSDFWELGGTRTLTLTGTNTGDNTMGLVIKDTGGTTTNLTKTGTGTWVLTGTNNYNGATTVNQGTLFINGNNSAATGAVTVASAGTLRGTGTIGAATTVNGTIHAGSTANPTGTLTLQNGLTVNTGATVAVRINAAGTGGVAVSSGGSSTGSNNNLLAVTGGAFTLDAPLISVDGTGASFAQFTTYSYLIGTSTSGTLTDTPTFNFQNFNGIVDLNSVTLTMSSNNLYLNFVTVPEPGFYLGVVVLLVALLALRFRA